MGGDKEYEGTLTLGTTTDSQDAEGKVLEQKDWATLSEERVREVIEGFKGDILQTPPMVSAVKVNGVPLYKLARKGKEVERKQKLIHIYRVEIQKMDLPHIDFSLLCTKGTYVRTICHDIGQKLDCGGHLSRLKRVASGSFRLDQALPLHQIESWSRTELEKHLISPLSLANLG
jgi:tRNA pseudouridine55 synthase